MTISSEGPVKYPTKLLVVSHVEKSLSFIDKNTKFDWLLNFQKKNRGIFSLHGIFH